MFVVLNSLDTITIRNISHADVYTKQIKSTAFPFTQPDTNLYKVWENQKHLLKVWFTQSSSNLFQTSALREIAISLGLHSFNLYA